MSIREALSVIIKQERRKNNLTQEKLADLCSIDRTYISLLERKKRNPTVEVIFRLSRCFNMKPSEFLKMVEELTEFQ